MNRKFILALGMALLLGACAPQEAPPANSAPAESAPTKERAPAQSASGDTQGGLEAVQELPVKQKLIPGCRNTLPYPLVMGGESAAADFSKWTATDLDGNQVDESILAGSRLTLVQIWATYCGGHMEDLETLQQLYTEYGRSDLNVVGILASAQYEDGSLNKDEVEYVKYLLGETGAKYPQLLPSDDLIQIKLKDLGIIPESFLLDSQGNQVGQSWTGSRTADQLRETIDKALEGQ